MSTRPEKVQKLEAKLGGIIKKWRIDKDGNVIIEEFQMGHVSVSMSEPRRVSRRDPRRTRPI